MIASTTLKHRADKEVTKFGGDVVLYQAWNEEAERQLINNLRFIRDLQDTPYVPRLLASGGSYALVEYVADEPITDRVRFAANCTDLRDILERRGIVHGDLTRINVLVRDNVPVLCDFDQSRYRNEDRPDKRPEGDAYWIAQLIEAVR